MAQEKTEKPTTKKLKDARKKGRIARSRDLAVAGASVAATMALAGFGRRLVVGLGERLAADLSNFGDAAVRPIEPGDLTGIVMRGGGLLASLVGPIALATMAAGVCVHGFQGGWSFAPATLQFNWSRLNPANNAKKFKMVNSGADTIKALVSGLVIAWLGWQVIWPFVLDGPRLAWASPVGAALTAWEHIQTLLWRVAWGLAALAVADYALQKYRLFSSLRMSKQEIRRESKDAEGNPQVKGRVRQIQRAMARRRMINDVAKATVVITNPTHFAIALKYQRGSMAAPLVLAKGADHLAAAIRKKARDHGIPIVENRTLAQALYKTAEVGQMIPAQLFAAVAEVLAQLIRLKQLVL
jgi:flagellar biosynthetic protein FlhB